jgi:hypothetical protein
MILTFPVKTTKCTDLYNLQILKKLVSKKIHVPVFRKKRAISVSKPNISLLEVENLLQGKELQSKPS